MMSQISALEAELAKMRVKELKKIISAKGGKCTGCTEKPEFVQQVLKLQRPDVRTERVIV